MKPKILLFTPPFSQLNTPYPATAYIKGFLDSKGLKVFQEDLSIELFTSIFTKEFLVLIFNEAEELGHNEYAGVSKNKMLYCRRIEDVIGYLQSQTLEVAERLIKPGFLPIGHRLAKVNTHIDWPEGEQGIIDKAKHYGTLFIEEIGDFIHSNVDEFFSFTRYAEQIATSASSFDGLADSLEYEPTIIEHTLFDLVEEKMEEHKPTLVCFTVPFPGNLFATLRASQFIKQFYH